MRGRQPKKSRRLQLLRDLYEVVFNETESLEAEDIGADLAYLMGAVLKDSCCDWDAERPLVQLLREQFPGRHPVWRFIHIEPSQSEQACSQELSNRELATVLAALRYWQDRLIDRSVCHYQAIAKDGGKFNPLSGREIDQLCERLNSGD